MNRQDFQNLSDLRLKEAESLMHAGLHKGAYYLAGYAVECALKACIAKLTQQHDYPDKKRTNDAYCHVLTTLVRVAELQPAHQAAMQDPQFAINWGVVKDWSEEARYKSNITAQDAHDLLKAMTDPAKGVLPWVKSNW